MGTKSRGMLWFIEQNGRDSVLIADIACFHQITCIVKKHEHGFWDDLVGVIDKNGNKDCRFDCVE